MTAVASDTARPRTRSGQISEITVHTTGPSENANDAMNTTRATRVNTPATETPSAPAPASVLKKANPAPTAARLVPVSQPSLFIAGERDASIAWMAGAIAAFPTTLPGLVDSHIIAGSGHWVQQERPDEVNRLLVEWLGGLAV